MRKLILILTLAMLIGSAGAIKWGDIELREGAALFLSSTAPGTTTNALYSDAGVLKFNGSNVVSEGGKSPFDIVFNQTLDGTWTAYDSVGTVLDSDADIGHQAYEFRFWL